eukprot:2040-Pelagomonas_calceolata.AAC.2
MKPQQFPLTLKGCAGGCESMPIDSVTIKSHLGGAVVGETEEPAPELPVHAPSAACGTAASVAAAAG